MKLINVVALRASRERRLTNEDRFSFFETTRWRIHVSQRNYILVFVDVDVVEVLLFLILLIKAMNLTRSIIFHVFQIVEKIVVIVIDIWGIVISFYWRCVRRCCITISIDLKIWSKNRAISWILIIVVAITWDDDEIREIDEELIVIKDSFLIVAIVFKRKLIRIDFVLNQNMIADELTKSLSREIFKRFIEQLELRVSKS